MSERPDLDFGYRLGQNACSRYVYNPHAHGFYEDTRPREMTAEDLGYDKGAGRLCFHGKCPWQGPCIRLDLCCGRPPFVREQEEIWAEHQKQRAAVDAPYAFWLGADA